MLMTREQIQEHLQLPESTFESLVKRKIIPFLRINNQVIRFDPAKVDAALAANFEGKDYTGKRPSGEAIAAATAQLEKARIALVEEKRAKKRSPKKSRKPTREKKPTTT